MKKKSAKDRLDEFEIKRQMDRMESRLFENSRR